MQHPITTFMPLGAEAQLTVRDYKMLSADSANALLAAIMPLYLSESGRTYVGAYSEDYFDTVELVADPADIKKAAFRGPSPYPATMAQVARANAPKTGTIKPNYSVLTGIASGVSVDGVKSAGKAAIYSLKVGSAKTLAEAEKAAGGSILFVPPEVASAFFNKLLETEKNAYIKPLLITAGLASAAAIAAYFLYLKPSEQAARRDNPTLGGRVRAGLR